MLQRLRIYADQYPARLVHDCSLKQRLGLQVKTDPGYFIRLGEYYLLPIVEINPDDIIDQSELVVASQALGVWQLMSEGIIVGYVIQSNVKAVSTGCYLSGVISSKADKKPDKVDILYRNDSIAIIEYKSFGFLAVSSMLSEQMSVIMEEQ